MKRFYWIILFTLAFFLSLFFLGQAWGVFDPDRIQAWLSDMQQTENGQLLVALVIVGLLAVDLVFPIPSSLLMTLSGMFFGVILGTLVCFTGSMATAFLGFSICRYGGHGIVERIAGKEELAQAGHWFDRYGVIALVMSRPVPMLTEVLSCLAGLSDMRKRIFFIASAVGHFPVCLFYSFLGSQGSVRDPWPVVAVSLAIPGILLFFYRRKRADVGRDDAGGEGCNKVELEE